MWNDGNVRARCLQQQAQHERQQGCVVGGCWEEDVCHVELQVNTIMWMLSDEPAPGSWEAGDSWCHRRFERSAMH